MTDLAVIFEIDGVLADSYQRHFRSWQALYALYGEQDVEYSESEFAVDFGRTSRDILRRTLGTYMAESRVDELADRKEALYRDTIRANFPAMDGAIDLINELSNEYYWQSVVWLNGKHRIVTGEALLRRQIHRSCYGGGR